MKLKCQLGVVQTWQNLRLIELSDVYECIYIFNIFMVDSGFLLEIIVLIIYVPDVIVIM